jgi:hypothetical protein
MIERRYRNDFDNRFELDTRVCKFASSLLAASPELDAQTALKAALQVVRIMVQIEQFEAEDHEAH